MKRLFVARELPIDVQGLVGPQIDVQIWPGEGPPPPTELRLALMEADAAVVLLSDQVDGALLDACPRLRVVANYAVGYDNIDAEAAAARGVWVTNTPDVLTEATADLTWALLLGVARRVREGDQLLRQRHPWRWAPSFLLGKELHGSTLGIIGFGRIGRAVARRASGFGMKVVVYNRSPIAGQSCAALGVEQIELSALLERSDVVSVHCPLTPNTHHLLSSSEFRRMKRDAILLNARGPIVDEAALAEALSDGVIGGAGLDVFEEEPAVHPGLLDCASALLLPHLGSATEVTRSRMAEIAVQNALAVLLGEVPITPVNTVVGLGE